MGEALDSEKAPCPGRTLRAGKGRHVPSQAEVEMPPAWTCPFMTALGRDPEQQDKARRDMKV